MATLSNSESTNLYSWWWDSHITPKNSKWLKENLTDMDAKVKAMIKLIEEDADSFARRAEMYYKKRPELMKLVEEFYRAYRALAERYDYATGELRQAHRTIAEAFPDRVPSVLADDLPSGSANATEPHMPGMPSPVRAFLDIDDLEILSSNAKPRGGRVRRGLNFDMKEKEEHMNDEVAHLSNENQNLKTKVLSESERAGKAESEVQNLKKALADMQAEKEAVLSQYQQSLEKLSSLTGELICAEKDARRFNEQASKAESEFFTLKEAVIKLEAERDGIFAKNKNYLERISVLEVMVSRAQEDAGGLEGRTLKADIEAQYLRNELFILHSEKEAGLLQYQQCLEKISSLEKKVCVAEGDARHLTQNAERAETEVEKLKVTLAEVTAQKESITLQYNLCLEKISQLEREMSRAQEDIRRLSNGILTGAAKLSTAEVNCNLLEVSNQTLQLEADNLAKKIALKDKQLSEKHEELEELQFCLEDERARYDHVEVTLHTLQNMHSQSQEEQRTLALELKNGLKMLKDLAICKHDLEEEIQQIKDENQSLSELNSSSTMSINDLQNEILDLTRMKERLEKEVCLQFDKSNTLQQEICCLKEEIDCLNRSYQALIEQVESVGLNPNCLGNSVKELQDENSRLRQICLMEKDENESLFKKLVNMEEFLEKNAALQSSPSEVNGDLEGSPEKAKVSQNSCDILHGEKSALLGEKAVLLSKLEIINDTMQKILERNAVLETSLRIANVELEDLRGKSKSLEELSQLLGDEKAYLLTERSALAEQLEIVKQRLSNLEKRFTDFEKYYDGLEKVKDFTDSQLEEIRASFRLEKQEQASSKQCTESRLATLENNIHVLGKEGKGSMKEVQEEIDEAVISQFEMYILQNFAEDMEEKNHLLLMELQKQIKASKLAENLIWELEDENLEQLVEEELLLVEIEMLRSGIYQVSKVLDIGAFNDSEEKIEHEQNFVPHILNEITKMKHSLSKLSDGTQLLVVENSVLQTILGQLGLEGQEVELEKNNLYQASKTIAEQLLILQSEKHELLDMNRQLRTEVNMGNHRADVLMAQVESLTVKQAGMQSAYLELQEEYSQMLEENISSRRFGGRKEEKEEDTALILDMLTFGNISTIFKNFRTENAGELKLLAEDIQKLHGVNYELEKEVSTLREQLCMNEIENLFLRDLIAKLEMELSEVKDSNYSLKQEISNRDDFLSYREKELLNAEQKLIMTENLNSELCSTVERLKRESEKSELIRKNLETQILNLSNDRIKQMEIQSLLEVKGNLEAELGTLNEEIEKRRIIEENLNLELQEKQNEFELWESEAATFYFNLQYSSTCELLLEDKIHELTGICKSLQDENASKTQEIELLKERVFFKAREIGQLKSQLFAHSPAIVCLKENIESLEHSALSFAKLLIADYQLPQDVEFKFHAHEKSCQKLVEDQNSCIPFENLDVQKLQGRIKAVENVVVEGINRLERQERFSNNIKEEATVNEIENSKSKLRPIQLGKGKQKEGGETWGESRNNVKLKKAKPEHPEVKNGILMKDIQLDQVSDSKPYGRSRRGNRGADQMLVWETGGQNLTDVQKPVYEPAEDDRENPSSELELEKELGIDKLEVSDRISMPTRGKKNKILERLASDGQKLANIQLTVMDLKRKLETNKKSRNAQNVDLETVKEQLQEADETALQLIDLNGQMTKTIEEIPFSSDGQGSTEIEQAASVQKKSVAEQARKQSEKIGRLQLEIQKIQYVLLKLDDGKKIIGKNRFSRTKSRTTIILRDFIHSGKRSSVGRQKKGRLCGCFKPASAGGNI